MTTSIPPNPLPSVLVPLDGSPGAEVVLPAATVLAQRLPASITLLHTIERDAPETVHGERHLRGEAEANAYLARIAERLRAEGMAVDWHVHIVPVGDVPLSIASHANEEGARLIVLSTHPPSAPRSWLMGAVAQGVIQHAAPPVLLLRTDGKKGEGAFAPAEVTVALDPEQQGAVAIPTALRLARALAIPLRLLVAIPTVGTIPGDQAAAAQLLPTGAAAALDLQAETTATELAALAERLRRESPDVSIVTEVARGEPAQVIVSLARERRAMVALATHGRTGLDALWSGSVGSRVVSRGDGPFLLVHPEPANMEG